MKHFALNDQEANRCSMLCTWSNEQAMREIYLRPFELSVKEGDSMAVMSSFNYIGNRWAGGTKQLCETVLRDEWGFRGFVETDYFGVYNYMSADQAIRNGTDLMLVNYPTATNDMQFTTTNGAQQRLRQSAHRILYVVVNSRSYTDHRRELRQGHRHAHVALRADRGQCDCGPAADWLGVPAPAQVQSAKEGRGVSITEAIVAKCVDKPNLV